MATNDGSVAPKERVNIVYKSATGDAKEDVELPMKQLVLGDFTLRESDTPVDERKPVSVDKDTFSDVLKGQKLSLSFAVPNRLAADAGAEEALPVDLHFDRLSDFEPDAIVEQVPELKQLIELRDALKALKGPLGNLPEFRKRLGELVADDATRERLLAELGSKSQE